MSEIKMNYGCKIIRPEVQFSLTQMHIPLWKRIWWSLTRWAYEMFLIFMMSLSFTVFVYSMGKLLS